MAKSGGNVNIVTIDVQCSAIGRGHWDLLPCSIVMASNGVEQYRAVIKVPGISADLETMHPGLDRSKIDSGVAWPQVHAKLREKLAALQPVVIVGHAPQYAVVYMDLQKGRDYRDMVDMATWFRDANGPYFGLRHVAYALLDKPVHKLPSQKAQVEFELYAELNGNNEKIRNGRRRLEELKRNRGFPDQAYHRDARKTDPDRRYNRCRAKFTPEKCRCSQPCILTNDDRTVDGIRRLMRIASQSVVTSIPPLPPREPRGRGRGRGGGGRGFGRGRGSGFGRGRGGFGDGRGGGGRGRGRGRPPMDEASMARGKRGFDHDGRLVTITTDSDRGNTMMRGRARGRGDGNRGRPVSMRGDVRSMRGRGRGGAMDRGRGRGVGMRGGMNRGRGAAERNGRMASSSSSSSSRGRGTSSNNQHQKPATVSRQPPPPPPTE